MGLEEHREPHYSCHINKGINLHFFQEIKASDRHIHEEIEQEKKDREKEKDREKKGGIIRLNTLFFLRRVNKSVKECERVE